MQTVTVSPKFQVVIPKEIRESAKTGPGTEGTGAALREPH